MSDILDARQSALKHLASLHSSSDRSVVARQQEILDLCSQHERTIEELAEHFEMNYYTIYRNVKELVLIGLLVVLPIKQDKKHLYRTDWSLIKQSGQELVWRSASNEFIPVSEWIERLEKGAKEAYERMIHCRKALVATHVNKERMAKGLTHYEDSHDENNRKAFQEALDYFHRIIPVLEQALAAPLWEDPGGHEMFRLPASITEEEASETHDRLERYYHAQGRYDEEINT